MRLSHKGLKEAFLAECNRATNLQLGKAQFKNYEVAHFLNAAYMARINFRMGLFDERYVSSDHRITGIQKPQEASFPASMRLLLDFGDLYISSKLIQEEHLFEDAHDVGSCGTFTRLFPIPRTAPAIGADRVAGTEGAISEVPYLVNVQIHEYKAGADATKPPWTRVHTQLCRPINPIDVTRMSLMYQDDKYMPYTYYRVRPIRYNKKPGDVNLTEAQLNAIAPVAHLDYFIEVSYEFRNSGTKAMLTCDMIKFPEPITETNMAEEAQDKYIEVMFGYEIAQAAAAIAMESLGAGRAQTLAQVVNSSSPQ